LALTIASASWSLGTVYAKRHPTQASPYMGAAFQMIVGGTAVALLGTVLGATLTQVIYKGLNLLQFQLDQLKLYIGLVLLVALSLDRVRHVLAERRGVRA